jgi:DNA-binding CsgD family transcriptional regulator
LRPREAAVVQLIVLGLTSKEIARRLAISPLTVRKHRENAMRRLGAHTVADLIRAGRSSGLGDTPSEPYRPDDG